jgi:hypothetical protein
MTPTHRESAGGARRTGERGAAILELPLLIAVVIVPFAFIVLTVPTWISGVLAADTAAAEAGRAFVLSGGQDGSVETAVRAVEESHRLGGGSLTVVSTHPSAALGSVVEVEVSIRLRAVVFFDFGSFEYTARHAERYPTYVRTPG